MIFYYTVCMTVMSPIIVLVAELLVSTLSSCSADHVYCIIPTLPANTSCLPCPYNSTHCTTLSEYAQETENFTSNTTMVFIPGDHNLDVNITVAGISRLTMHGKSSSGYIPRIVCNGLVGFSFRSMVNLQIHFLTFITCGRNSKAAMVLESMDNAELVSCSFWDNLGGIIALNSNLIFTGNTSFIGNDTVLYSAGISVKNCSVRSNGSIHFVNNSKPHDTNSPAVAIWALTSSLSFVGTSNFINNFGYGSAIYAYNTSLSFSGNSNFTNSLARSCYGGAINTESNTSLQLC